ncbi:unnamed protein product [Hymenolepis diminuta]|uniref:PCI domain-containing protein n=1 Tax=Hymenolepis diminuta TaxID=6216 RepID=A0A0R3SPD0_HYMDI|nr:unnamed protein product [Hymenolepis diminuta]VUZ52554.1 unnamed protein product [Hymenolepis diminuta]
MASITIPEEIIKKATEAPNVFTFAELRDVDCIKALAPNSQLINLLDLFCYGSYGDHKGAPIPPLSDLQIRKLRLLTILSACEYRHNISYDDLLKSLELTSLRELEDLIIELIYADAIVGKLNQQKRVLLIESAIGRDFKQDDLPKVKSDLDSWCNRVNNSLKELADNLNTASTCKAEYLATKSAESASTNNNAAQVIEIMEVDTGVGDEESNSIPEPSTSLNDKGRRITTRVLQKGRKV